MSVSVTVGGTPLDRIISLGNAPVSQTGAGGQWVNAWSYSGVTALHKADAGNATEAWSVLKYTDLLASTLAGGDIYRGDLGVSGVSSATSSIKQEVDGREALRFNLAEAAKAVTLNLASFFANDEATGYAEALRLRLFDAQGNLVDERFITADSLSGNQLVQVNSEQNFRSLELSAGAQRADGSFAFGAYNNADGSFGTSSFNKHGSDFLLHAISFTLARPHADADSYTLDEDAPQQSYASVLANDQDPNGQSLTAVLEQGPSHGTLSLNADGSFVYRPDADYNGSDSFSYHASNGKDNSDSTSVSLTIKPVNDAPVALGDTASTNENTVVSGNVLDGSNGGKDSDKDGDTLVVSNPGSYTTTLGATVTLGSNGAFSYDPRASQALQALNSGEQRTDGFDYMVSDGHGGSSTAHVAVVVNGVTDTPPTGNLKGIMPNVQPGTELTYYMRYTDGSNNTGWMKLDGFSFGASAETSWIKGSGAAVGKPQPEAFELSLGSAAAQAAFTSAIMRGGHLERVEIEAYAGDPALRAVVQEFNFSTVYATGVQTSAGADGSTSNHLSFVYQAVDEALTPLTKDGAPSRTAADFAWNVATMNSDLPAGGSVHDGADAIQRSLDPQITSSTPLEYFIHVDGVDGWVPLSGFSFGFTAETSFLKGSGASVGKAQPDSVKLDLGQSAALVKLMNDLRSGTSTNVQIEAYADDVRDGSPALVDEYFFNSAFTTAIENGDAASNSVDLVYKSFTHAQRGFDKTGQLTTPTLTGFDLAKQQAETPPTMAAEALSKPAAPSVEPGSDLTYYMRYTDGSNNTGWMKIDGFSFGASAESSWLKGSGAAVGKPQPEAFELSLGSGAAQAAFTSAIMRGTHLERVEIEAYAGDPARRAVVQEFNFSTVYATAVQTSAGADGSTSNHLSFVYKAVDEALTPLTRDGTPSRTAAEFAWNVTTMNSDLPAGGSVHDGADAILRSLDPQITSSTPLEYFIHVDGVDGWVPLSGFSFGFTAETSFLKGSGASVGKAQPDSVKLDLGQSAALVKLMNDLRSGASTNVQIEAYAHDVRDGTPALVDEYFFNSAFTSAIENGEAANNSVNLVYKSFTHAQRGFDKNGQLTTPTLTGFDLTKQQAETPPTMVAEALSKPAAPSVEPGSDLTYYMRYTDGSNNTGWVKLDGFSFGASAETSWIKGSGAAVGKPQPEAFELSLGSGAAQAAFTKAIMQGTHLQRVEIEAYAGDPARKAVVQEFNFSTVFATGVQTSAGADGSTSNHLSFVYQAVDEVLTPLTRDGSPSRTSFDFSWNVSTMNDILPAGGSVHDGADAILRSLDPQIPSSTPLAYFIHVDGVDGWVPLSGFSFGFTAEASFLKGSGASVGKAQPDSVKLDLGQSAALVKLMNDLRSGTSTNVQIEAYAHGGRDGAPALVDEYFFNSAFTSAIENGEAANNSIDLVYRSFTHAHRGIDSHGGLTPFSLLGFDLSAMKTVGVPDPVPDVFG
ncbi:tandem-95 repeat protein [Pseudoduganella sp. FT93W]|uniref:Tandem-95 repeat protein n=1 Tax=Duganella fentianensis TaxID=2692177 RepID=A0A845HZK4_9BURK|nr:cadherin-like domain-containing protein [Duganella fentianensis]MYN45237.1 tandem-95 repeat protein [Duganella fentianensis]